uniref:Uncharacterized protein n=1 Tax=Arundo donax TaxID=35708 RepID=A0A0A9ADM8_ARUDO
MKQTWCPFIHCKCRKKSKGRRQVTQDES